MRTGGRRKRRWRRPQAGGGSPPTFPMAFAAPPVAAGAELRRSSWTPLSHRRLREQVFEERRALLGKWFDKWTDGQRRKVLVDLLERCSLSQQKFCAKQLQARVPTEAIDFTTRLPRVLSLYIFSFLDPRSLCRCAQVSWHWKYLSELDQLWMLKCLRFGWLLNFCPTPLEQGVWKKHYIQMVRELHLTRPQTPSKAEFMVIDVQPVKINVPERNLGVAGLGTGRGRQELPPWRCPDRKPADTARYNHLDNLHPIEQARQGRRKGGANTPDLSRQEAERRRRGGRGSAQLLKVKSLERGTRDGSSIPRDGGDLGFSIGGKSGNEEEKTKPTVGMIPDHCGWERDRLSVHRDPGISLQ
ncbi:F-box only protein 16 [Geothlypis trichas]